MLEPVEPSVRSSFRGNFDLLAFSVNAFIEILSESEQFVQESFEESLVFL